MTEQINPETTQPEQINPQPATRTRSRNPKPSAVDYSLSVTGTTLYPRFQNKIPADLLAKYPEFNAVAARLTSYGYHTVKFFFTYSPDAAKPNRRTGDQFYITLPLPKKITVTKNAAYLKSSRHKITGKIYFILFPEIKSLFTRLEKHGISGFILNISYNIKSGQRREHIIRTISDAADID